MLAQQVRQKSVLVSNRASGNVFRRQKVILGRTYMLLRGCKVSSDPDQIRIAVRSVNPPDNANRHAQSVVANG